METRQSFKRAQDFLERSLQITLKVDDRDFHNLLICYFKKAELLTMQCKYGQALESFNEALKTAFNFYETELHPFIARIYMGMGLAYYDLGDFKTAKEKFVRSLNIEKQLLSSKKEVTYRIATIKIEIGRCLIQSNKYEDAVRHLTHCWEMMNFLKHVRSDEHSAEILVYI